MKLRQAKQLLKQYPPILKVFIPDGMSEHDRAVFNQKLRNEIGDRFVVMMFPNQFKLDLTPFSIDPSKIEEFKKVWEGHDSTNRPFQVITEMADILKPVQVMSVLGDRVSTLLYSKQLLRVTALLEELD